MTHLNWLQLEANEGDINQYIRSQGLAESPRTLRVRGGDQGFYSEFVRMIFQNSNATYANLVVVYRLFLGIPDALMASPTIFSLPATNR